MMNDRDRDARLEDTADAAELLGQLLGEGRQHLGRRRFVRSRRAIRWRPAITAAAAPFAGPAPVEPGGRDESGEPRHRPGPP